MFGAFRVFRFPILLGLRSLTGVCLRHRALGAKRPEPPFRAVSAHAGDDPFCNRIAAVKPLFLLWLMSQVDPNRSLVAGNRDGEKCSRAVIEPGTASDGIRRKLSFVGALWVPEACQKRRHRPHHHGGRQLPNRLTVSGVPSQGDGQGVNRHRTRTPLNSVQSPCCDKKIPHLDGVPIGAERDPVSEANVGGFTAC